MPSFPGHEWIPFTLGLSVKKPSCIIPPQYYTTSLLHTTSINKLPKYCNQPAKTMEETTLATSKQYQQIAPPGLFPSPSVHPHIPQIVSLKTFGEGYGIHMFFPSFFSEEQTPCDAKQRHVKPQTFGVIFLYNFHLLRGLKPQWKCFMVFSWF